MNPTANRRNFAVLVVALFSLALVSTSAANMVSYQGILTNAGGDSLLSGEYDFVFAIFPQSTGGTAWWTEPHNDVDVENGIYSVILGSTTALPDSIGDSSWLQITVNGTPLTPRLAITADFRAIEARRAENADSVNHIPASASPQAGHLLPLDGDAKIPLAALPFTLDSIQAGAGLTGTVTDDVRRPNSLDDQITINVGAGDGIIVNPDNVQATLGTSISTAELENGSVFTGKLADGAVITSKLADNSVTTGKVVDNTLVVADIAPDIVSSVDGVHNDGGDIDLIPGNNITIVPNDPANTITISTNATHYLAGRCINIVDTTINNVMDIEAGDECIAVEYDANQCLYTLRNQMDIAGGECVFVEYDSSNCNYLISIDPDCIPVGTADSIFHSEVYARSFVNTPDGTIENAHGHWESDGRLTLHQDSETGMVLYPNGTWGAYQNAHLVAGLDTNGELFARSMMVIDSAGDTLIHLSKNGNISSFSADGMENGHSFRADGTWKAYQASFDSAVAGLDSNGELFARSMMVIDSAGDTLIHLGRNGQIYVQDSHNTTQIGPDGIGILGEFGSGMLLEKKGWEIFDGLVPVAKVDSTGEIFAQSFYTLNDEGDTVIHLTNDGQILINGDPIGQGGGTDSIFDSEVYAHSFVVTPDGSLENETAHILSDGTFQNRNANDDSGMDIHPDGTWEAYQGDPDFPVAGLDDEGEMYANSFYVPGIQIGTFLAHITSTGDMVGQGIVGNAYVYSPVSIFSGNVGGTQASDLAPGYMRSQMYSGTTPLAGWSFLNNGTMTQRISGVATPNMSTTIEGYHIFMNRVYFGLLSNNNHMLGGTILQGTMFSNNVTIFGKLNVVGDIDPIISERFSISSKYVYEKGTVIVADPNSDYFVPCYDSCQTSVVGVVSPSEKGDYANEVLAVILGAAASPDTLGNRLEVRVKADAKYGAIKRGDLLTTSATVGHAMLASDPKLGTIIGKALESLAVGKGEIKVMVTLQ